MTVPVQSHPHYAEGFWDARDMEPLYPEATEEYRAGWLAFWRCKEMLTSRPVALS